MSRIRIAQTSDVAWRDVVDSLERRRGGTGRQGEKRRREKTFLSPMGHGTVFYASHARTYGTCSSKKYMTSPYESWGGDAAVSKMGAARMELSSINREGERERESRQGVDKREILAKIVRTAVPPDDCWDWGARE